MITTICLHAWTQVGEAYQEYADPSRGDPVDGWCVYRRIETPEDAEQPFEIVEDEDFTSEDAARARAAELAAQYACPMNEY